MTARQSALLLLLALPALGACRAEGYVGHRTSRQSSAWALGRVGDRFDDNVHSLLSLPERVVSGVGRDSSSGVAAMQRTWNLYRFGTPNAPGAEAVEASPASGD